MERSAKILSDVVIFSKYAKHIPELNRRESYDEICDRNIKMHLKKFKNNPEIVAELNRVYRDFVRTRKVLPSMRSFQFGGRPIELNPARLFNCCTIAIDHVDAFGEVMFLLLSGCGVGYSVQKTHISDLPVIRKPLKKRRYVVNDSIAGWADAVKVLMKAYLSGKSDPVFDFSDIREKGAPLITSGGKAPGPQPLHDCLHHIKAILNTKKDGDQLTSIEVFDIVCHIADAVLSGGIRRSATICLFDIDDVDMLTAKSGNWWELNPQRGRANISASVIRHKITEAEFMKLFEYSRLSGAGEPGIFLSNNTDYAINPCGEISIKMPGFCNLTEVNVSDVSSQEDLEERVKAAAFLGTIQASYTDFYYLRDIWKRNAEKESLLGVSLNGIASGSSLHLDYKKAANIAVEVNTTFSKIIGINPAARVTTVKPSGTSSLVLGCSSGIHAYHDKFYIRRMRLGKDEAIYSYLKNAVPDLVVDDVTNPKQAILEVPIKSPDQAMFRDESPIELLERVKMFYNSWILGGHVKGDNTNNISVTVSIKDDEWEKVGKWMWENRDSYTGISVLPFFGGTYAQTPFESTDEETYNRMYKSLNKVNLNDVIEKIDTTNFQGELACSGGACEVV
jgi:ribonucleoside-diphosphate reductase alpha chain